jgi:hypothetical protein
MIRSNIHTGSQHSKSNLHSASHYSHYTQEVYRNADERLNQYEYVSNPYDFYGSKFIDPEDVDKLDTDDIYEDEGSNLTVNLEDLVAEEGIIFSILQ